MSIIDIDQDDPGGPRLIECLVGEVLSEFATSPAAYLRSPDTWERFYGLAIESTYAGETLTPLLGALAAGELAQETSGEVAEYEQALCELIRPALLRRMLTTD
jgi:hypothetical protein